MAYTHFTAAKLAAQFHVTVPMMREALVQLELLDEFTNAPTAEGHLIGEAVFVENLAPRYQLFPSWPLDKIEKLLPELAATASQRETINFQTRFEACSALNNAGGLLSQEFPNDDDVLWLQYETIELGVTDTRAGKKGFAKNILGPMTQRLRSKIKKHRRGKRPHVVEALGILDGVHCWATGERIKPDLSSLEPVSFEPETVDRASGVEEGFVLTEQELKLLEAGYCFNPVFSPSPMPCFNKEVLYAVGGILNGVRIDDTYIRMSTRGDRKLLFVLYNDFPIPGDYEIIAEVHVVTIDANNRMDFGEELGPADFQSEIEHLLPRGKDFTKSRAHKRALAA